MKKQLPEDAISRELAHSSVFFQKAAVQDKPAKPQLSQPEPSRSPAEQAQEQKPETRKQAVNEEGKHDAKIDSDIDVNHDVMTSLSQDIDLRTWQEIIENTETQNTALRLTTEERYAIEDAVNELRRKYGIKTSMNEVARLGLMLIIHDFKKNKKESMIHKGKKA
jgi:hypothetical protein